MKKLLLLLVLLIAFCKVYSQDYDFIVTKGDTRTCIIESPKQLPSDTVLMKDIQKNSVYVGLDFSINYSRLIPIGKHVGVSLRGGLSFLLLFEAGAVTMVGETALLIGGLKHFFEPGLLVWGPVPDLQDNSTYDKWAGPMIRIGYRYQGTKGFLIRPGLFYYFDDQVFFPGVSIGYSF